MSDQESNGDPKETFPNGDSCIFCRIASNKTDTEIVHCNDEMVCFRDVKPGAPHHYLVVPRAHLGNCTSLRREDAPLVLRMVEMAKAVLHMKGISDLQDTRLGFHMPPFSSVPHLHLHVLAPASHLSSRSLRFYGPHSFWFLTVENLLKQLESQNQVT
ncbi:adenosine 5'-monophosphoramidase HINT3-like [Sardina pilchardus]|uniref:adenosine 5'-monophosphoramidase HINT3-like n=1 Tax=Sardina pilchardus TaxID=27697 RepID=UPI002E131BBB